MQIVSTQELPLQRAEPGLCEPSEAPVYSETHVLTKMLQKSFPQEAAHAGIWFCMPGLCSDHLRAFVRKEEFDQPGADRSSLPQPCDMNGSDSAISALLILIKTKLLHIPINPGSRVSPCPSALASEALKQLMPRWCPGEGEGKQPHEKGGDNSSWCSRVAVPELVQSFSVPVARSSLDVLPVWVLDPAHTEHCSH